MLRRWWFLGAALLVALVVTSVPWTARGEETETSTAPKAARRALLIGIQTYLPTGATAAEDRHWSNLEAPVRDVACLAALLEQRFGFEVYTLTEGEATRDGILKAIRKYVIEPAKGGDLSLLYYAGHGSQIPNEASAEDDELDETIVPADAYLGRPDIRDKGLRRLLGEVPLDVRLILWFDSCHSGTITRGAMAPRTERRLLPSKRAADGAEAETEAELPPPPETRNAVRFTACQDDETAKETHDEDGHPVGVFTWALRRALQTAPADVSPRELHMTIRGLLAGWGESQHAGVEGPPDRLDAPLFGSGEGGAGGPRVVAGSVEEGGRRVELLAGTALGLRQGCRLASTKEKGPTLRVTTVDDIGKSTAEVEKGAEGAVLPGDLFEVVTWAAGGGAPLRVWMPPPVPPEVLETIGDRLGTGAGGRPWIQEPTETPPESVLAWNGSAWVLETPAGVTLSSVAVPSLGALAERLDADTAVYVHVPPTHSLAKDLRAEIARMGRPIVWTENAADADYLLVGRRSPRGAEYAWALRDACRGPVESPMPTRTNWCSRAWDLADLAERLHVVWGWQHLQSPEHLAESSGAPVFPYRLVAVRNDHGDIPLDGGGVLLDRWDEGYDLVLRTRSPEALTVARQKVEDYEVPSLWHCYVGAIDANGEGCLITTDWVVDLGTAGPEIVITNQADEKKRAFGYGPPYGVDTWYLLATQEKLLDPGVLVFSGVKTKGMPAGEKTALGELFAGLARGTRGEPQPVPTTWVFDRHHLRGGLGVGPSRFRQDGSDDDALRLGDAVDEALRTHGGNTWHRAPGVPTKQHLSGTYRIEDGTVHVRVRLGTDGWNGVRAEATVEGAANRPDLLARRILERVYEDLVSR